VTSLLSVAHIPWVVKPLYGFISDSFPIRGERRRPYLVGCALLGAASFWLLGSGGLATVTPATALVLITASELSVAFSDVVVDAVVVEVARGEPQATAGALQSLCWGAQAVGSLSTAWTAGAIIESAGPRRTLALMAAFPLLVAVAAGFIREQPLVPPGGGVAPPASTALSSSSSPRLSFWRAKAADLAAQTRTLLATLRSPAIFGPAVFIYAYHCSPSAGQALFYFYSEARPPAGHGIGLSPSFIGKIALLDGFAALAGVWVSF
jgi:hypothetical protein